jgi:WD40 repeat protein
MRKVCLYHPFNGYTRALDINGSVCMAFSNKGDFLAVAYRKSRRGPKEFDLFVFRIEHKTLFDSEHLDTEKIRTTMPEDVTALCFTRLDDFLMCGTQTGRVVVIACLSSENSPKCHKWQYVRSLSTHHHKAKIRKISFSCNYRYMATLDVEGSLVIWNGASWTVLYSFQKEKSSLYVHLAWHPYVEEELVFGKRYYPALYLINIVQKDVVACYMNWNDEMELSSIAFNPVNAQLAVCFYNQGKFNDC